ncbi:MAG: AAA family ATPase [Planctomycetota bacterium]|nr:AAA family ATPase [Planctomycetota bacterium]
MIDKLQISGYRLLHEFAADLGQLTVVIGANATGKSTLIDALRLICECAEFPLEKALTQHGWAPSLLNASSQAQRISWELTFRRPKENRWALLPLDGSDSYTYDVSIGVDRQLGHVVPEREVLRLTHPRKGFAGPFKFFDTEGERAFLFDPRQRKLVPFEDIFPKQEEEGRVAAKSESTGGGEARGGPPEVPVQERTLRLAQMRFHKEFPVVSWIRTLLASMAFYPGFDVGRFSALRMKAAEIRPETTLWATGENLGTVLHEMLTRHDHRPSAELLRDFMKVAYPSFEEISAETAFGTPPSVLVRVREAGMQRPMELWDLSDGMLRFLCLGAALLNPLPPPFVAIDEPEAGLHPRLLPIIADIIKTASERTQVLITTHSPDLLNQFDLDDVAVMSREGPHAVWRRPGSRASLRKMLESVAGDTLGDLHRTGELEALE